MSNKKILLFSDWFTPGFKAGGPIQSCKNFVNAFKEDFELFIITSDRDMGDDLPYENIQPDCWLTFDTNVRIYYGTTKRLGISRVKHLIDQVSPEYIYLNSLFSLHFTIMPLLLKRLNYISSTVVLAPRGMLQEGALKFKGAKKKLYIRLINLFNIPGQLVFHATDKQERDDILHYFPSAGKVFMAPNFTVGHNVEWKEVVKRPGELKCIFLSRIAPKKNVLFLIRLFRSIPDDIRISLNIYGSIEDDNYWKRCEAEMAALPRSVAVTYEGPINNDLVFEVYRHHHLFVLPTLGENFGHAIFEAMLAGKPVLVSDKTPWRNLESLRVGFDILLEKPDAYVSAILRFAGMSQEEYNSWSQAAFNFAREYVLKERVKEKYEQIFET